MKASRLIIKNIFSLSVAEVANKGITLITTAYLSRIIMPEGLGLIGFATAFTIYFLTATNLGFTTIGIREVAKAHDKVRKYTDAIMTIRVSIAIVSSILLGVIVYLIDKPLMVKYVILISGINILSNSILIDWVFQAIEKMEVLAVRQVVSSILTLAGTFIFVHSKDDIPVAMAVVVASATINAFWIIGYYIKKIGPIKFNIDMDLWKSIIKSSIPIGMTGLMVVLYNNLNMVLLGFFRNNNEAGIYNAASKIVTVIILASAVIQNAFFPMFARAETLEIRLKVLKKYSTLLFLIGTFLSGIFFTFSDVVVKFVFGVRFANSADVLRIMMVTVLVQYFTVSLLGPLMAWNREKEIFICAVLGGVTSLILNLMLIPYYGYIGASIAAFFCEFAVLAGFIFYSKKLIHKVFYWDFLKILSFSILSCIPGYLLYHNGLNPLLSGLSSLSIFLILNFLLKTITINELKGYLSK